LKVGENGKISHGVHGFDKLTENQLTEVYGPERVFKNGKHMTFLSFLEAARTPVVCQLVHLIKNNMLDKTYETVAFDLY
jgi:hypothetical protein